MSNNNQRSTDGFRVPVRSGKSAKGHKRTLAGMLVIWVALLAVIASIGFSSYMVYFGTDDSTAKILILPQVVAAGLALIVLPIVAMSKMLSNK